MTLADWMILVAAFLPILFVGPAKAMGPKYDNARPREWEKAQSGWLGRAIAAHNNQFEVFPPFAAGVLVAQQAHGPQGMIDLLALLFIVFRLTYYAAYVADRPSLRSILWTCGFACVVGLFIAAA